MECKFCLTVAQVIERINCQLMRVKTTRYSFVITQMRYADNWWNENIGELNFTRLWCVSRTILEYTVENRMEYIVNLVSCKVIKMNFSCSRKIFSDQDLKAYLAIWIFSWEKRSVRALLCAIFWALWYTTVSVGWPVLLLIEKWLGNAQRFGKIRKDIMERKIRYLILDMSTRWCRVQCGTNRMFDFGIFFLIYWYT